jgi:hypothetical protein
LPDHYASDTPETADFLDISFGRSERRFIIGKHRDKLVVAIQLPPAIAGKYHEFNRHIIHLLAPTAAALSLKVALLQEPHIDVAVEGKGRAKTRWPIAGARRIFELMRRHATGKGTARNRYPG